MLQPGDPAPEISATNQRGETIAPDFGEPTVVYFYPKDFTGGCTIEANDFQDALPEFRDSGITVYGVSLDDVESHADFAEAEGIEFDLLADPEGTVADAFGMDTSEGYTDRRTFGLLPSRNDAAEVAGRYDPGGRATVHPNAEEPSRASFLERDRPSLHVRPVRRGCRLGARGRTTPLRGGDGRAIPEA